MSIRISSMKTNDLSKKLDHLKENWLLKRQTLKRSKKSFREVMKTKKETMTETSNEEKGN